jgi:cation diffusion facilitator CzcD-associated flavoprotein CzcO
LLAFGAIMNLTGACATEHPVPVEGTRPTVPATSLPQSGTVVIGGSQAGLAVGYHLARRGLPFIILDQNERVGAAWRKRWDSLRLFTPVRYCHLPGMRFPEPALHYPGRG